VKGETKLREEFQQSDIAGKFKRSQQTTFPMVTEMLDLWAVAAEEKGVVLTGDILRAKFRQFSERAGIAPEEQLKMSNGWLESIKNRLGLSLHVRHGEAGSASAETVMAERARLQELLSGYSLEDIFNGDETGLYYS
jgi:Tc5 transposase DNA-binding domain